MLEQKQLIKLEISVKQKIENLENRTKKTGRGTNNAKNMGEQHKSTIEIQSLSLRYKFPNTHTTTNYIWHGHKRVDELQQNHKSDKLNATPKSTKFQKHISLVKAHILP